MARLTRGSAQHELFDLVDRMAGQVLGYIGDDLGLNLLVHLLAQFAEDRRRGDKDDLGEAALVGVLVETIGDFMREACG